MAEPGRRTMRSPVRTAILMAFTLLSAAILGRCSSSPPVPDVEAELQKLKIPTIPKTFTPAQKAAVEKAWTGPGQFFVKRGCIACHAVSVYDIKGFSPIAPDLSIAIDDVRTRFGRTVEDFLDKPQGTMEMVLNQLIKLTPEDKKEAIKHLQIAHEAHQSKLAAAK